MTDSNRLRASAKIEQEEPSRVQRAHKSLPKEAWPLWAGLGKDLSRLSDTDWDMVERAALLANHAHKGQARKSGEPYITHPMEVARSVAQLGLDAEAVCAALDEAPPPRFALVPCMGSVGNPEEPGNPGTQTQTLTQTRALRARW